MSKELSSKDYSDEDLEEMLNSITEETEDVEDKVMDERPSDVIPSEEMSEMALMPINMYSDQPWFEFFELRREDIFTTEEIETWETEGLTEDLEKKYEKYIDAMEEAKQKYKETK